MADHRDPHRRDEVWHEGPRYGEPEDGRFDAVAQARAGVRRARVVYPPRDPRRPQTLPQQLRGFVRRYGWRAYAIPVLLVVTVAALMTTRSGGTGPTHQQALGPTPSTQGSDAGRTSGSSTPPIAPGQMDLKSDSQGANADKSALKAAALPPGDPYTKVGKGTFRTLAGHTAVVGRTGQLYHYTIDVENGVKGIDLDQFQNLVDSTLADHRSWSGHGVRLKRVGPGYNGTVDFHVTLTSSMTVRKYCGYSIPVETSCYATAGTNGLPVNRVFINDSRWVRGDAAYLGDLGAYRVYMINHEDGHALGHEHAHQCLPGGLAPVMMQQTFGLISAATGKPCQANPWPYPPGAKGAPGAEQPDTAQNDEYPLAD